MQEFLPKMYSIYIKYLLTKNIINNISLVIDLYNLKNELLFINNKSFIKKDYYSQHFIEKPMKKRYRITVEICLNEYTLIC